MKILENEYMRIGVEDLGAQLCSLYDKRRDKELLWNADPSYWGYHAPVLFPLVGMVNEGQYRYCGKTYHVRQHGFARQSNFTCVSQTADKVIYKLTENEDTLNLYPFAFCLEVSHEIKGNTLKIGWKVENPSPEETMYFSIGAHPAFMVPAADTDRKEDCYVLFHGKDSLDYILPDLKVTAADTEHVYRMELDEGYLKLKPHLFDIDTFIFENGQVEKVSLCGSDRKPYITVCCEGFPYFGLWTKSDDAPFVCLEPWHGRLDDKGFTGELPEKTGIISLKPGEVFETSYTVSI